MGFHSTKGIDLDSSVSLTCSSGQIFPDCLFQMPEDIWELIIVSAELLKGQSEKKPCSFALQSHAFKTQSMEPADICCEEDNLQFKDTD